jgi:ABC-type Zn uptake system ZnuABC Zn-binding protein ZnuA
MPILTRITAISLVVGVAIAGCTGDNASSPGEAPATTVLASNAIVADWVENVAGAGVGIETIVPPGADLHTYQLSPSGVRAIAAADLIILVGADLESAFESAVSENAEGTVIKLADTLDLAPFEHDDDEEEHNDDEHEDEEQGHDHGEFDPHIWMDPGLAIASVERIATALTEIDPDGAATYEQNAERYVVELRAMDESIAAQLSALDPQDKLLVTFHDAYGYFAERYRLTILGFVVENADEEPSAARVAALIEDIRESGAVAIYREPQFNGNIVNQVAAEADISVRLLPSDTLSGDYPTYIALMHAMADAVAGNS